MSDSDAIVRHLLAAVDPDAVVLDRNGDALVAPHGAPDLDRARFREALARLDAGDDFAVIEGGEPEDRRWRLQPIREDGRVVAALVLPRAGWMSREELLALVEDAEVGISVIRVPDLDDPEQQRIELNNRAAEEASQTPLRHFRGQRFLEAFPVVRDTPFPGLYRQVVETQQAMELPEIRYGDGNVPDAVFRVRLSPLPNRAVLGQYVNVSAARRAQARLDAFFREAPVGLCILDEALAFVTVNPSFAEMSGAPIEEHVGQSIAEAAPTLADAITPPLRQLLEDGKPSVTHRVTSVGHFVVSTFSLPGTDPSARRLGAIVVDVTEQQRAEEALRATEERFRVALQSRPMIVFNQDRQLRYTWVNRTGLDVAPWQTLGFRDVELLERRDEGEALEAIKRGVLETGEGIRREIVIHFDGEPRVFDLTVEPLRDEDGAICGITGVGIDVTERLAAAEARQAELERMVVDRTEAVMRSEAHLRAVLDNASEAIVAIDDAGSIVSCNRGMTRLLGYEPSEVVGRNVSQLMNDEDAGRHDGYLRHYDETGLSRIIGTGREVLARTKDGTLIPVRLQVGETRLEGERMYVGVLQDVRPERRAQAALRYQATLVDSMSDAVVSTDLEARIVTWTGGAEAIYGWSAEEAIGHTVPDLLESQVEEGREEAYAKLLREGSWNGEAKQTRKDGEVITVASRVSLVRDVLGKPIGMLAINADVTAVKELEARYAHMQKMEALGRLTAGIAHDFGNLLMGISGCAALALARVDPDDPAAMHLLALLEAVERGAGLSRQLMSYSRKQDEIETEVLELDVVVDRTKSLLERLVGDDIELITELGCPGEYVRASSSNLEQILVNLVVNARDAMPEGGTITLRTEAIELDHEEAERRGLVLGGRCVQLTVADTGQGMDETTRARVFEPFFTTKPVGSGTGLGLSTVYVFVKDMGGSIEIHSEADRGTSMVLLFPCSEATETPSRGHDALPRGRESVLVVEDEELVRLTVRHHLEALGYAVVDAVGPVEALRLCEQSSRPIDLLLSDVVMPEIGGREMARRARISRPELRVLFMSAHPREHLLSRGNLQWGDDVLQKPFGREELAAAVRRVLDAPGAVAAEVVAQTACRGRILVVDDAELTRMSLGELLRSRNHEVVEAATGQQAIAALERNPAVDLVLVDYSLPDMKGTQLVATLRQRKADLGVLYMSGHSRSHVDVEPDVVWMQKPIDLDQLFEAIEDLLPDGEP